MLQEFGDQCIDGQSESLLNSRAKIHPPKPPQAQEQITVGLIGCDGQMGKMLRTKLEAANVKKIIGSDPKLPGGLSNQQVVEEADLVIFAVPVEETVGVIKKLTPFSRPGQGWVDVTSVKGEPVRAMLAAHPQCDVIGLHPLFGPGLDWRGQTIVVCQARGVKWIDYILDFIRFSGATSINMGPDRHDEMMAIIQAWAHAMYIIGALSLRELCTNLSLSVLREVATPQFKLLWSGLVRIFAMNNPAMYFAIQTELPEHTVRNLTSIAKQTAKLFDIFDTDDFERFNAEYRDARNFIGPDLLEESTDKFNRVTRFLADLSDMNSFEVVCKEDRPGLLSQVVSVLAEHRLNMTSLHSKSVPGGGYSFRITTEQRRSSREVQGAIGKLRGEMGWVVE
jgi:prephenate dehydrogenase